MSRPPTPVTAAGGVVFRTVGGHEQILLMFRRGEWDLPKGKIDAGETIAECALREVSEETGIKGLLLGEFILCTYHEYTDAWGTWDKTTHWYRMRVLGDGGRLTPQAEEQIEALEWVGVEEALRRVRFDSLKQVLSAL